MFRFRYVGMVLFAVLYVITAWLTDPNNDFIGKLPFGAGFAAHLVTLLLASSGAVLLFLVRKTFFDYPEADIRELLRLAKASNRAAGLALIGLGLHMIAFAIVIVAMLL